MKTDSKLSGWFTATDYFWVLFPATFLCKVAWSYLYFSVHSRGTPAELSNAAMSIARGEGLGDIYAQGTGPSALVAPLYAYYMGGLYWLFGTGRLAKFVLQLGSLVASSAAIAQLPAVAKRTRLPASAGLLAALVMAVSPFAVPHEINGYWEAAFASLGFVVAFRLLVALEDSRVPLSGRAIAVGVSSGFLMLLSPSVGPGILLAALAGWFQRSGERVRYSMACGLAAVVCAGVMSPWVARNYLVFGRFVPVRSNYGLQLYIGNHPAADGRSFGSHDAAHTLAVLNPHQSPEEFQRYKELGDVAYGDEKQAQAIEWIRANPGMFTWLCCLRFRWYWFPGLDVAPDVATNWFPHRDLLLGTAIWYDALGVASFVGIGLLFVIRQRFRWHYLALSLGPSLAYMITHVDPRYRYPSLWVSALLTGFAVTQVWQRVSNRLRTRNAPPVADAFALDRSNDAAGISTSPVDRNVGSGGGAVVNGREYPL
jgi:hypothetical protein